MDGNQPIVLDNGSGSIKAGFSGNERPRVHFRSMVGRNKYVRVMPGGVFSGSEVFMGAKCEEHRGSLILNYPIEHGMIKNWHDMETIWGYMYSSEQLRINPAEHPVLITEPPLNPLSSKMKTSEIFFESFNAPALYFGVQSILSLYASGRTTGVVLDCGDGVTQCVPVYEGFALPHAISRIDLAGSDITSYLQLLLRKSSGKNFVSTSELEILREIKESKCYIATESTFKKNEGPPRCSYLLPDGAVLDMSSELSQSPEVLFRPYLIGSESPSVQDALVNSIMRADMDLRKTLFSQIVLSGGSTLLPGFGDRLLFELRRHISTPKETKIRMAAPPDRLFTTWIGGSILSSLSTFKNMWISRRDFLEQGDRIIRARDSL